MFTAEYPQESQPKMVTSYKGVDLSNQNCHKLQMNPLYKKYDKQDIHYIVDAAQKGLKPYTQHGLKRIKRKNAKKLLALRLKQKNATNVAQLNPKSPEFLCIKAIRTEFLTKFSKHVQDKKTVSIKKSDKIMRRKLNQRRRRNELIRLVKQYREELLPHFGARLSGYGRCPKVSRQQIKDFLYQKGITPDIGPEKFNPLLTPYAQYAKKSSACKQELFEISELNEEVQYVLRLNKTPVIDENDFPSLLK